MDQQSLVFWNQHPCYIQSDLTFLPYSDAQFWPLAGHLDHVYALNCTELMPCNCLIFVWILQFLGLSEDLRPTCDFFFSPSPVFGEMIMKKFCWVDFMKMHLLIFFFSFQSGLEPCLHLGRCDGSKNHMVVLPGGAHSSCRSRGRIWNETQLNKNDLYLGGKDECTDALVLT